MSVAILGAVISVVAAAAAVVSAVWARQSGRVQSSSAEDDLQDKFNQLISTLTKLQGEAAELGVQGMAPAGSAALAKQLGLGNQLEVVGSQSHAMLHPTDKSEPTPDLDWSAAYILAATFDQTWHADWAEDYWKRSVEKAEDDAKLIALVGAARHYFMRNDEGDLGRGRDCHNGGDQGDRPHRPGERHVLPAEVLRLFRGRHGRVRGGQLERNDHGTVELLQGGRADPYAHEVHVVQGAAVRIHRPVEPAAGHERRPRRHRSGEERAR